MMHYTSVGEEVWHWGVYSLWALLWERRKLLWRLGICPSVRLSFFKDYIYLFLERGREGEKHQYMVASCTPPTGDLAPQPRHVPWLGIKAVTLWFPNHHSIHWATLARSVRLSNCIYYLSGRSGYGCNSHGLLNHASVQIPALPLISWDLKEIIFCGPLMLNFMWTWLGHRMPRYLSKHYF